MKLHLTQQHSTVTLHSKNSHVQIHMANSEIRFAAAEAQKPIRLRELLRLQSEVGKADGYPETPARMTHLSGVRYDDLDSAQGPWRTVSSRRLPFYSGQHELRDGEVVFGPVSGAKAGDGVPIPRAPACDARVLLEFVLSSEARPLMIMLIAEHVTDRDDGQDGQGCHQTGRQDGKSSWFHRHCNVLGHAAIHIAQG